MENEMRIKIYIIDVIYKLFKIFVVISVLTV